MLLWQTIFRTRYLNSVFDCKEIVSCCHVRLEIEIAENKNVKNENVENNQSSQVGMHHIRITGLLR